MSTRTPLIEYIIKNQQVLIQVDFIKEIFMIPERLKANSKDKDGKFIIKTLSPLYLGKLFVYDNMFYGITSFERIDLRDKEEKIYQVEGSLTGIKYDPDEKTPLCTPQDPFTLEYLEIENHIDNEPFKTTIGRFVANYLFLVYPFGKAFSYLNEEFTTGKLEKRISLALMDKRITVQEVKDKYINTLSLFGASTDIFSPNISEKTITIPKEIHDLREQLVRENKEALEAGDASVMSKIEGILIDKYKEYLKGDSSLNFLLKSKYFNVTLKKLFLTHGMVEVFGSPGKFTFVDNPLSAGWKQKDLPTIFNEVRQGSYARAIETANGGVIAKLILRVLQDTRITSDDCHTTHGEHIHATRDQLSDFIWNYTIESDGSNILITQENLDDFVGKDIVIRTPGYCIEPKGFCAKCFGRTFEIVGQKAFAPVANDFARNQTVQSLKSMHGKSHQTINISNLNKYLVK